MEDTLLTVGQVAKQLSVDASTVRRWIKDGAMEAVLLPNRGKHKPYRVRQSTIDTLLASKKEVAP